jgi:hypothetical protein
VASHPIGQVLAVGGNPAEHQFGIVGANGLAFVDSNRNTLATLPLGGVFWGMRYSAKGTKLYATLTVEASTGGPYHPLITTYDTSSFSLVAYK